MTPEEKRQFDDLKRQVEILRRALDVTFVDSLSLRYFGNFSGVDNDLIKNTITIGDGGGNADVLAFPDNLLTINVRGKQQVIPSYDIDKKPS